MKFAVLERNSMGVLNRKLLRDLWSNGGVLLLVVAIIMVGTGSFIGLTSSQRNLKTSQAAYYEAYRFADFWIDVKKAPLPAVERIATLPGVAEIESRIVFDVILDIPGVVKPLTGRLISTPPGDVEDTINGICLIRGSQFSDDRNEEIIISEAFATAHHLGPGDRITLILNRKRQSFVIVGTAISPEYVYMVRGRGDLAPDPEHFGVLYIKEAFARDLLDFGDACNQIVGRAVAGFEDIDGLLDRIERRLDTFGVLATTPRERQPSHRFLSDEINGLRVTAMILPTIFLLVAGLVLNILMNRLAERQRTVIGTLKALGYSNRQVLTHFVQFGVAVGLVGGLAGNVFGVLLAQWMIEIYKGFFQFPHFAYRLYPDLLLAGVGLSLAFSVSGAAKGVWRVLKLEPSEAMRPKPPERGGPVFLERFPALWKRLGFRTHIAFRTMARHPGRTFTGILASALSGAIIFMTLIMYDSTFFLIEFQFDHITHSDADLGLRDEASRAALLEAERLPGVDVAEPVFSLACELRNGWRSRRVGVTGLAAEHRLTTPLERDLTPVAIPPDGLVMSSKLADILAVGPGDTLELTPIRGRRETVHVRVASIIESYLGLDCYADLKYLSRLVGEALVINGVQLAVDSARTGRFYAAVKELPNAQALHVSNDARLNLEKTLLETMSFSLGLMVLFAGLIAFGSMLNNSLIEIGDRIRDISTFRVLGYNSRQVAGIFFRQNMTIYAIGLAVALPLGYTMSLLASTVYDTELFRMPVVVSLRTVLLAAGLTLAFVMLAQWFVYRQIRNLDWVEGTKVKE